MCVVFSFASELHSCSEKVKITDTRGLLSREAVPWLFVTMFSKNLMNIYFPKLCF